MSFTSIDNETGLWGSNCLPSGGRLVSPDIGLVGAVGASLSLQR